MSAAPQYDGPPSRAPDLNAVVLALAARLEVSALASCLPLVAASLTSLSLRHNDQLLTDEALCHVLHALCTTPSHFSAAVSRGGCRSMPP